MKMTRLIAALLFCALSTLAHAGSLNWSLDRSGGSPYKLRIDLDGVWHNFGEISSAGQPLPYFASTFCNANEWITATAGVPSCSQPAFSNISGDLDLATQVTGTLAVGNGGTGLTSGTSGGVLAFTAAGTLASSAALTANLPVIGGGAGVAPSVGTRSGNTTQFVTTTGAQTSGDCVEIDANGNHVASGAACGTGGGGGSSKIAQGRLTLTTATPVLTSNVTGATTVYFTPYNGDIVPVWNGSSFTDTTFTELSQATTDSTKSPAAVGASSNYDVFVWNDGGTLRATRGPAWSSATARGTGAGTTELAVVQGIKVNAVAITNGPGTGAGTYVGTIRSNASSTIDFIFGGSASGGTAAVLHVWNNFNRVNIEARVQDSDTSWTYATATARPAHNSTSNRISFVSGIAEDGLIATYFNEFSPGSTANQSGIIGVGMDSTTAMDHFYFGALQASVGAYFAGNATAHYKPQIGSHFIQALERPNGAYTATFLGGSDAQLGMFMYLEATIRM